MPYISLEKSFCEPRLSEKWISQAVVRLIIKRWGKVRLVLLSELLSMRGLDLSKSIKLVRHQDPNYDTKYLYMRGMLDFYQSIQSKDRFGNCEYLISFLGYEQSKESTSGHTK